MGQRCLAVTPAAVPATRFLAPQHGADARQQFTRVEGLGHVVVGAELEPDDAVDFLAARRQHDHRRSGGLVQPLADRQAVFPRHHVVENDQADVAAAQDLVHFASAGGGMHFKSVLRQELAGQFAQFEVVVDDQNAWGGGGMGRDGGGQGHVRNSGEDFGGRRLFGQADLMGQEDLRGIRKAQRP